MTKKLMMVMIAGILGIGLAGCQEPAPIGIGTAGGAVAGGLVGSAFGSGSGQTAAIIGGALLGGYVGNQTIDRRRAQRHYQTYQRY